MLWSLEMPAVLPTHIAAWHCRLPAEEQARADRFRFAADRAAHVAAHGLLRALLASHGATDPRFLRDRWGKPELQAPCGGLRCNLTHTRDLVAAAVALIDDVGVDAETTDPAIDVAGLAARFFAPAEAAMLRALPQVEQASAFCRVWTLKEAILKAIGRGLSMPLDAFAFVSGTRLSIPDASHGAPSEWSFQTRATRFGHLSVALRVAPLPGLVLRETRLSPEDLAFHIARHPTACEVP